MLNRIKKIWRGEVKLWKAFWLYGFVGGLAVNAVFILAMTMGLGAYTLSQVMASTMAVVQANASGLRLWLTYVLAVMPAVYSVWVSLVVWKSAFNASMPFWGYLARGVAVLSFIGIIFNLHALMNASNSIVKGAGVGATMFSACNEQMAKLAVIAKMSVDDYKKISAQQYARCTCQAQFNAASKGLIKLPQGISLDQCIESALSQLPEVKQRKEQQAKEAAAAAPQLCEKTMTETAQKAGSDPKKYIAANQAYFQQCVKYYSNNPTAVKK